MIGYAWGKIKGSVSGWEKSHFGGFYRMISDYPYIKLSYDIHIECDQTLIKELHWYTAEKLIKLYLIKLQSSNLLGYLRQETKMVPNKWTGREQKYVITYLDNPNVMQLLMDHHSEFAPLFEHYRDGIMNSYLTKEIKDDQNKDGKSNPGESETEESEGKESKSNEEKSESQKEHEAMMQMKEDLEQIKEHEPWTAKTLSSFSGTPKFMQANQHNHKTEYTFTRSEIKDAENLLKMLDISFDPKEDVVKSLRAGKLDACKIAEVAAGSTSIYKQTVEDQDTKPFGVCILADLSGSMQHANRLQMQKHTLNVLYLALSQIIPTDKLWIYGHSGDENPEIHPFHTPYDTNYPLNIREYDRIYYAQNYDGPVIEAIHKKIRETCDDRIIFISLSDGSPAGEGYGSLEDVEDMRKIIERARRDEFVTVGIGMQYAGVEGLYQYIKIVDDLDYLARDVSQIVNKVVRAEFK